MPKACNDFEAELSEFDGEPDHLRPLVFYPPKVTVSALVNPCRESRPRGFGLNSPAG